MNTPLKQQPKCLTEELGESRKDRSLYIKSYTETPHAAACGGAEVTFLRGLATCPMRVRAGDPCTGKLKHPGEKWDADLGSNVDPHQTPHPYKTL